MSKNADTIALGGNRFDCGPKVMKKTGLDKVKMNTDLFIKTEDSADTYMEGFETSLKEMDFR